MEAVEVYKNRKDYSGLQIGQLKIMSFHSKNLGKRAKWNVQCVCGKVFQTQPRSIISERTKSCGCKKSQFITEKQTLPNGKAIINEAYGLHVASAKRRGLKTELNRLQYEDISKRPCHYCGEFSYRKNTHTGRTLKCNSIDRLNNERFYSLENSVPCCFQCQTSKMDYTEAEFLEKIRKIHSFRGLK